MPSTQFFIPNTHVMYSKYAFYTNYTFYLHQVHTFLKSVLKQQHSKNVVLHNPDFVIFVIGVFGHVCRRKMQQLDVPEFA